ncbi:MBL fold metallo-hydrolase [Acetobacter sp. TBRC 12305]|uniref:MBL fold metallo-hydrolase n=2 Tax=Acetobacter garciniae TaxID=2817435 RepID=A0A939HP72_9PROT|nr:MBL fold metallo-hydrolase [Acetobacter garciniae]MBO1326016.1 MBL fold metallo-hydrolase [Acetobacter garciniae]MBX0345240.1 MBL fold metallo-hydrolase [Acetobacter garciniae]
MQINVIPVTPFRQNCSVLWDPTTRAALVVDPGGDADVLLAFITRHNLTVEAILLTHGHLDHAGGVAPLCRGLEGVQPNRPVVIGPDEHDAFLLSSITEQARHFGLSGLENASVDRFTREGDVLNYAGRSLRVLHVPGHTPGHVVFVDDQARFAFVGDVLFQGSVGRTDFPYGDGPLLIRSIKDKLLPLLDTPGGDITFVPGHGGLSTLATERASNPFLQG